METRKKVLGDEHPSTLSSIANLASTYSNQGRWKEAEELEVQVMETRKKVLGDEHPSTLSSIANLASTYSNQGRWKEAEELEVQVMETRKKVLGDEHPSTLSSIANLASTYSNQGRWKEAEKLEMQVMETSFRVLGKEHPDTLSSIANLASTYMHQGRLKEAEELEVQVIETRRKVLGEEHPDTLSSMANLASMYMHQGRLKEAEELYKRALEGNKEKLGPHHPDTLGTMQNLANVYANEGRYHEAKELYKRVLTDNEEKLGPDHPDTLRTVQNLAIVYKNNGQYDEAEKLYEQALAGYEKKLGSHHPDTLRTVGNLANVFADKGRYKEAEKLYLQALQGFEETWGSEHTLTLDIVNNLGALYIDQGKMEEAQELYQRSQPKTENDYGLNDSFGRAVIDFRPFYTDWSRVTETIRPYQKNLAAASKSEDGASVSDLSDVSSLMSMQPVPSSVSDSSLPSATAMRNDNTRRTAQEFASLLFRSTVLRPLYEGLAKLGSARFNANHDNLLIRYFKDLRHECRSSAQKDAVRVLRVREQRNNITSLVLDAVGPYNPAKERAMAVLTQQKSDRQPQLESYLALRNKATTVDTPPDQAEGEFLEESMYMRGFDNMENAESSDDSDSVNQYPNLDRITEFLMEAESFAKFQSNFRYLLSPPKTLSQALGDNNVYTVERYITDNFATVAKGQFEWLWEVERAGYSKREIASLLFEEARDAPWIIFEPEDIETPSLRSNVHVLDCYHVESATSPQPYRITTSLQKDSVYSRSELLRVAEGFCGLGGVVPSSSSREKWNGTVTFKDEPSKSYVTYRLYLNSDDLDQEYCLQRVSNALTGFCRAAALAQSTGFCCDCFTVITHAINNTTITSDEKAILDLRKIKFSSASELLEKIDTIISAEMSFDGASQFCADLLGAILGDLLRVSVSPGNFVQCIALTVQFLCIGFLSYLQGHAGPIDPFFLEHAQSHITLVGIEDPNSRMSRKIAIETGLVNLSCLGQMIGRPVLAFSALGGIQRPTPAYEKQYDVTTSIDDLLDTWGPGHFIHNGNNPDMILAIGIGGGYISRVSSSSTIFHWSRARTFSVAPLAHFSVATRLLIGALAMVNTHCYVDEEQFRNKHSHYLKQMGTREPFWSIAERQFGIQAGNYVNLVYNDTYKLKAGESLKARYFHPISWLYLSSDLNHTWGLQVSLCTGIARRVRLRDLLADLLPKFIDPTKQELWQRLKTKKVTEAFENGDFTEWLQQLDVDLQCYLLALVRSILEFLKETGFDHQKNHLVVAWPVKEDLQRCLRIPCEQQSQWASILSDSTECATFAYVTTKCLIYDSVNCQNASSWGNSSKLLATAISCADSLRDGSHYWIKTFQSMLFVQVEMRLPRTVPHIVVNPSMFHLHNLKGWAKRIMQKEREKDRNTIREKQTHLDKAEEVIVRAADL